MLPNPKQRMCLLLCACLVIVTLFVYWPVRSHEFVSYDDDVYVTDNPNVKSGLNWQNVKCAFTTNRASNWHPLTWLSHQLDCQLFDTKPGPQHLVNVLIHAVNALLLFVVLNRTTNRIWPSVFVAGLFALHPLNVESVAWIAERKNVLSTLFWLLTMLAYTRYVERPSLTRYLVTLVIFALGLMSKPMLVTLPFVLLLLDYWPLDRIRNPQSAIRNSRFSILNSLIEKVPFFLLSVISSIITYVIQQQTGAMSPLYKLSLESRFANAIVSYLAYIGKMFWPFRLSVLYPQSAGGIPVFRFVTYAMTLILVTVLVIYLARRRKYLLVGWLWYLGTLVPVIGVVQVGAQAMADRYAYVPLIGLFIIIAFGAADLSEKIYFKKIVLSALAAAVLFGCAIVTSIQLKYWKDSFSLFDHTLTVIENNYARSAGNLTGSAKTTGHLSESLRFVPNSPVIYNNFGNALRQKGRVDDAIDYYKFALELDPNYFHARYNLSIALALRGRYDEAVEQCRIYLAACPDDAEMYTNLGVILRAKGDLDQAAESFEKALQINPNYKQARQLLNALTKKQEHPQN
jgi:hypothetical protein